MPVADGPCLSRGILLFLFFFFVSEVIVAKKAAPKEMQRLDKIVAHITGWSRQQATKVIRDGGVVVGEEVILDGAAKVSINAPLVIAGFNDDLGDDDDALYRHLYDVLRKVL